LRKRIGKIQHKGHQKRKRKIPNTTDTTVKKRKEKEPGEPKALWNNLTLMGTVVARLSHKMIDLVLSNK
jgi:hypothetical protein